MSGLALNFPPVRLEAADAVLYPAALDGADALFDRVMAQVDWQQEELTLYGRRIPQPRLSAWYGDAAYAYSGLHLEPRPWPPVLAGLRNRCEEIAQTPFNSVLANLYRDGADSMDWHSDDEASLGPAPVIASVNLGAPRRFQLRRKDDKKTKIEISLGGGDVLVMGGRCQLQWQHRVPKTQAIVAPRVNLTFRNVVRAPTRP
ncbi:alpha-ketoglutarate-dependent dioxygenase AlkB [Thalassospiraceae bacterium LMO-SO8]|nr:alpha-ketoglutarate-dependent dioxygenase AlkB [Alphaproteobacteria bacterium LMO-S08]WND76909.1 alpha-ketoglutarate-dependent dioxygenase AlkB [Thalassospiraceae bacterium LMO-SO8]